MRVCFSGCVCPVGNSTQDIETHSAPDIIPRSHWEGVLGVANTARVHRSVSVFNTDDKVATGLPSDGSGSVGTDSMDSKGNLWGQRPMTESWKVSTGTSRLHAAPRRVGGPDNPEAKQLAQCYTFSCVIGCKQISR